MIKTFCLRLTSVITLLTAQSAHAQTGLFKAALVRNDSIIIPFTFLQAHEKGKAYWVIQNASEKISVENFSYQGDSVIVEMPVFESQFRFVEKKGRMEGYWIKKGASKITQLPFVANAVTTKKKKQPVAKYRISGRWEVHFSNNKNNTMSVGEFVQSGSKLYGTFLNATGDYRYLEGEVRNDSMFLSAFDGSHAFYFTAKIINSNTIGGGIFYSGASYKESWTAVRNIHAKTSADEVAMYVRPGEEKLHFSFKNLEGQTVSISDKQFENKVVIIQLMGSWCPNCMDETVFLSDYYNNNKQRGIEVIALAYEYSADWERSIKSLRKFQQRYNVPYTILNTEVAVTDSLRTEKTLPEVTPIKFFPSSVILDKKGKIRKLDTGFNGPATGLHYIAYKKELEDFIDSLLKE